MLNVLLVNISKRTVYLHRCPYLCPCLSHIYQIIIKLTHNIFLLVAVGQCVRCRMVLHRTFVKFAGNVRQAGTFEQHCYSCWADSDHKNSRGPQASSELSHMVNSFTTSAPNWRRFYNAQYDECPQTSSTQTSA